MATATNKSIDNAADDDKGEMTRIIDDERSSKRLKAMTTTNADGDFPRTFVTWNCNGLTSRCKYDKEALKQLVIETEYPDVLCWQEVRLKAASSSDRGRPLATAEYKCDVQKALQDVFDEYDQYWSLADTKYAGTLTLIRKNNGSSSKPSVVAFSPDAAIDLLLQRYSLTRERCGLKANTKQSLAVTNSKQKDKKQTSVMAFFAPKKSTSSSKLLSATATKNAHHHPDGRFQFFQFPGGRMDLLHTYVPNNGNKDESFRYRRQWDGEMRDFLAARKRIYEAAGGAQPPPPVLLWCGDLNVARDYRDGTHWERVVGRSRQQEKNSEVDDDCVVSSNSGATSIYEWWTDESKCFASGANKASSNKHPDNIGIASFTAAERRRFSDMLQEADLSDVWRDLHPNGCTALQQYQSPWDQPNWTWRGHLGTQEGKKSKYQGKGQRLDYFLLSPSSATGQIVKSCEILGYGERRDGLFCGSDHCAVSLTLKDGSAN